MDVEEGTKGSNAAAKGKQKRHLAAQKARTTDQSRESDDVEREKLVRKEEEVVFGELREKAAIRNGRPGLGIL
jgi:hypothetical protein